MNKFNSHFTSVAEYIDLLKEANLGYFGSPTSSVGVSIISSFYNVPKEYFVEANASILNQTFQNYEWIIADDCSTKPEAIAFFDSLPQLNARIKTVRRSKNGGLAAGRNTAISQAVGKYLFFMDTDDILAPTLIEKCVIFLETHPEFSFVNSYSVGFQAEEYWWNKGFEKPSEFIHENRVTGRLLYRRSDFEAVGGFDESLRFYEDWERWLKAISQGQKGWTIPEYLDCYRRTKSGLLATSRAKADDEAQVTEKIRSRYSSAFLEASELPDTVVERPMFDLAALRRRVEVENPVNGGNLGKRILCWFPHLEVGGADKFNLDLLRGLKKRGYDITIVTTVAAEHVWFAEFYQVTADIFHLPRLLDYGHWLAFSRYIIESRHIDIYFISNAYYAYYLLPILRKDYPKIAFVDYTHTEDPGWRKGGYPRVSCQFSEFLDRHIVTSNALASRFIEMNPATASKIKVCYINVDEQFWRADAQKRRQVRQQMEIADEQVVLLFPARMTGQKRPLFFIEIINRLVVQGVAVTPPPRGGGELVEAVNERVAEYGLAERVRILPFVSPEAMLGYYSAADVVLLPSAYEGISLVMYEAMAMGLPVVASEVGGQRELMSPGTGVLVSLGDGNEDECNAYIEALQPLLQDKQRREEVGQTARQRIEACFRLGMMLDRMEAFWGEARQPRNRKSEEASSMFTAEEILLWVQEFLAVDIVWHESRRLAVSLAESEQWAKSLERERDFHRAKSKAWQKVAQRNQLALNAQLGSF